jgi:hypothetical protein
MSGLMYRSGPDGQDAGNAVIQRFGPDKYTVTLKIVNPDGTLTETSGELIREKHLAADDDGGSPQLEDLAWLIGDWEGEFALPEGNPIGPAGAHVVSRNSFRWTLGKKFISLIIRDKIDGKPGSTGHEFMGHDNQTDSLGHWFFGSRGYHGSGQWSRNGDKWFLTWKSHEPNGKYYEGVSDHVAVDANTFTWQMRDITENGKPVPDWPKVTYRRRQPVASEDDGLWQAYRAAAVGTWNGAGALIQDFPELDISEGDKFKAQLAIESELDGMALVGTTYFEMLDKPFTAQARALAGWDPDTRQVRVLAVWSGALVEEIILDRKRRSSFLGTYIAKSPGSPTLRARIRMRFDTPDSYVITFLGGPLKGKELSRWKRAK